VWAGCGAQPPQCGRALGIAASRGAARRSRCQFPEHGVVVEIDGHAFHSSRAAFERDRLRDAEQRARGLRVIGVTWRQITGEPEALLVRIAQVLARRA
jgi:very-short-patch-repair endonuclease